MGLTDEFQSWYVFFPLWLFPPAIRLHTALALSLDVTVTAESLF